MFDRARRRAGAYEVPIESKKIPRRVSLLAVTPNFHLERLVSVSRGIDAMLRGHVVFFLLLHPQAFSASEKANRRATCTRNNANAAFCRNSRASPITSARTRRPPVPHHHKTMFALTTSNFVAPARVGLRAKASSKSTHRAVVQTRASADESEKTNSVSNAVAEATEAWTEPAAPPAPAAFNAARIDPADGSIAEAAPLGDDMSMLTNAMVAFKEPRAVEIINGRVAMIGWMLALQGEFANDQGLFRQVINTRTFTLADGIVKSSTFPAPGMFLIPVTVMAVLAASLAPLLRGNEESGLEKAPKDFSVFRAESEMTNGRGAMIGLVALLLAEKFTGGAALF